MSINLVDHRQEVIGLLAFSPVNLVEPDRLDALQLPVLKTPAHNHSTDRYTASQLV